MYFNSYKMANWCYRATEAEDSVEEFVQWTDCCWAWWIICPCSTKHKYV